MKVGRLVFGIILVILSVIVPFLQIDVSLFGLGFVVFSLFVLGALLLVLGFRNVVFSTRQEYLEGYDYREPSRMRGGLIFSGLILIIIGLGMVFVPIDFSVFGIGIYEIILFLIGLFLILTSFKKKVAGYSEYLKRSGQRTRF